jgi:hypothetical protein
MIRIDMGRVEAVDWDYHTCVYSALPVVWLLKFPQLATFNSSMFLQIVDSVGSEKVMVVNLVLIPLLQCSLSLRIITSHFICQVLGLGVVHSLIECVEGEFKLRKCIGSSSPASEWIGPVATVMCFEGQGPAVKSVESSPGGLIAHRGGTHLLLDNRLGREEKSKT